MTYEANVEQAAQFLITGEDANWELARLTYENTLDRGERNPEKVKMEKWCEDVRKESDRRFAKQTGDRFKRVWRVYGHAYKHDSAPSWTDAWNEISYNTKEEREERKQRQEPPTTTTTTTTTKEEYKERAQERKERKERIEAADPTARKLNSAIAVNNTAKVLTSSAAQIKELLTVFEPGSDPGLLMVALGEVKKQIEELEFFIANGKTRIDSELEEITKQQ